MRCCKACGQAMPGPVGYVIEGRTVRHANGIERHVKPQVAAFLDAVRDAYPRTATSDFLHARIWPDGDEPDNSQGVIRHLACVARRHALVQTASDWQGGYRWKPS